jgi:hypothetical protein
MELLDHYVYKNNHKIINASTRTLQYLIIRRQDFLHRFLLRLLNCLSRSQNERILDFLLILIFQLYDLVFSFLLLGLDYWNACPTSFYWSIHRGYPRVLCFLIYFWFWNLPYYLVCLLIPNQNLLLLFVLPLYLLNLLMSHN